LCTKPAALFVQKPAVLFVQKPAGAACQKVRTDFFDKLPAKSQNKTQFFILRFWSLRRVIGREREP